MMIHSSIETIHIGTSFGHHDAAIAVVHDGNILFAEQAERYTGIKYEKRLNSQLVDSALNYIQQDTPYTVSYYEKPFKKWLRQLTSGETRQSFSEPKKVLKYFFPKAQKYNFYNHHLSHAAAGFATSKFDEAAVLVIDAIGEFQTTTIWKAYVDAFGICQYKLLEQRQYPFSVGLFYSAFTKHLGFKPNHDEHKVMALSSLGKPKVSGFLSGVLFTDNFHTGVSNPSTAFAVDNYTKEDIASSVQFVTEVVLTELSEKAKKLAQSNNLVYMGGVALNCKANSLLNNKNNVWIMPAPGDAGSAIGAAALSYKRKISWKGPYLGSNFTTRLKTGLCTWWNTKTPEKRIAGIMTGRCEFGPRALGNRSILADPTTEKVKNDLNSMKNRESFQPFGAVVCADYANDFFEMNGINESPYMQYVVKVKEPEKYPAIVHVDGTSRIQTVTPLQHMDLYSFLVCNGKMMLNTSLNGPGQPIINNRNDAEEFSFNTKIPIFSEY